MVILPPPFIMECPVPGQGRAGRVPDGSGRGKGKKKPPEQGNTQVADARRKYDKERREGTRARLALVKNTIPCLECRSQITSRKMHFRE